MSIPVPLTGNIPGGEGVGVSRPKKFKGSVKLNCLKNCLKNALFFVAGYGYFLELYNVRLYEK